LEVDIPADFRKSVVEFNKEVSALNTKQERIFNNLMVAVLKNLIDTLARFSTSKEYNRYHEIANMQRKFLQIFDRHNFLFLVDFEYYIPVVPNTIIRR
jgi:hypothetical protein